jgi:hypothetical protein
VPLPRLLFKKNRSGKGFRLTVRVSARGRVGRHGTRMLFGNIVP